MFHFGVNLSKYKYSLNINKNEYAIINDKTSIMSFFNYLSKNFMYYDKEFIINYLNKVKEVIDNYSFPIDNKAYNIQDKKMYQYKLKYFELNNKILKLTNEDLINQIIKWHSKNSIDDIKNNYITFSKIFDFNKSVFGEYYTEEWCLKHQKDALKNYDINMQNFKELDKNEFNKQINNFLEKNKDFKAIKDTNQLREKSGYYILVLDKYNSLYIGEATDLFKRIKQHWSKKVEFDRLLFPINNIEYSKLSIDSFRILDTTRIYVKTIKNKKLFSFDLINQERKYINMFDKKFLLNRL